LYGSVFAAIHPFLFSQEFAMKPEIEVKLTNLSNTFLLTFPVTMQKLGATLIHERCLYVRQTYSVPGKAPEQTRARLRQEYDGLYFTVKDVRDPSSPSGTFEGEMEKISLNMEDAQQMMLAIGLIPAAYQETYRTKFKLGKTIVTLDEWPGLRPYVEVEGSSEEVVFQVVEALGFTPVDTTLGSAAEVYLAELGIPKNNIWTTNLTFANPPTKWLG
jgi:adenylate cyclase class IV